MRNTYIFKALTFDPTVIQLHKRIYSHETSMVVVNHNKKMNKSCEFHAEYIYIQGFNFRSNSYTIT